jgi:O-antigen/teichoic acid export membrane protein
MASSTPIFLYQIGSLLVNNSQPMIMLHYTNLTTVADYSIVIKLQVVLSGVLVWGTNSFIPTFREARERGDFAWMRLSFKRMVTLRLALSVLVSLVLFAFGNRLIVLWLRQNSVHFGPAVWLAMSASIIGAAWVSAYGDFLTVMDIIWIQVVMVILNGVGTAILTVVLAPRFGVLGAIIAVSFVNVLFTSWLVPFIAKPVLWADARMKEGVNP